MKSRLGRILITVWAVIGGVVGLEGVRVVALESTTSAAKFYIEKQASKDGGESWAEAVEVEPGDEIIFRLKFENIGTSVAKNVSAFDTLELATGMEYIEGSTKVKGIDDERAEAIRDGIFSGGVSLGEFLPGEVAEVYYKVRIIADEEKFSCGETTLYNGAAVSFGTGTASSEEESEASGGMATQYDKVRIVVKRECVPEELPETGPAEIILAGVVVLGVITGGLYYYSSRRLVRKLEMSVKGIDKKDKM
ncbi:hypothetical protein IJH66_01030 [Candidatus Saccharibacteria bacterium]|nr:hypothetical protein [Candidatus Saccharibacteria bacterium]